MRIAIDAMGGDHAPKEIVIGTEYAARNNSDINYVLYGEESEVRKYLTDDLSNIEIIHTNEKIEADDDPVRAVRRKKEASMVLAASDVKEGKADALFSCGNTGALVAAGLLVVGRFPNVDRPALMSTLPAFSGSRQEFEFLDLGANSDAKPVNILQHAILGTHYAKDIRQIENPTVGLLNIGTEENKGNDLNKKAYNLLRDEPSINFYGNVEARDLLNGLVDIIVTDGFTGNAVLKTMEGTTSTMKKVIADAILSGGLKTKLGGFLVKDAISQLGDSLDYDKVGGAILIGVKAPVLKSHGSSKREVVEYTLEKTKNILLSGVIDHMAEAFSE
ncbi:MAG: phosphate acyltransferase PlsX [Atopococcus tabaci]|uniref:Phosphate acyltransferase n=1 Tax=Atopococcus tabaci TaxID=269774 RepID=A0AA43RKX6_9LACT|nr:phosphate acyltransferase PlsX [Atopococcus tabaci]